MIPQRTNELLKSELGKLITSQIEVMETLITIKTVYTAPDLQHADVYVSVLPESHTGTALAALKKHSGAFAKSIQKSTRLRHVPRIHWHFDAGEIHASELDSVFRQIEDERNEQ
jgi:ribosome-binding factor A